MLSNSVGEVGRASSNKQHEDLTFTTAEQRACIFGVSDNFLFFFCTLFSDNHDLAMKLLQNFIAAERLDGHSIDD